VDVEKPRRETSASRKVQEMEIEKTSKEEGEGCSKSSEQQT